MGRIPQGGRHTIPSTRRSGYHATTAYPLFSGHVHPNKPGKQKATGGFVPLLNRAYNRWLAGYWGFLSHFRSDGNNTTVKRDPNRANKDPLLSRYGSTFFHLLLLVFFSTTTGTFRSERCMYLIEVTDISDNSTMTTK
jgi:hypothetical protein